MPDIDNLKAVGRVTTVVYCMVPHFPPNWGTTLIHVPRMTTSLLVSSRAMINCSLQLIIYHAVYTALHSVGVLAQTTSRYSHGSPPSREIPRPQTLSVHRHGLLFCGFLTPISFPFPPTNPVRSGTQALVIIETMKTAMVVAIRTREIRAICTRLPTNILALISNKFCIRRQLVQDRDWEYLLAVYHRLYNAVVAALRHQVRPTHLNKLCARAEETFTKHPTEFWRPVEWVYSPLIPDSPYSRGICFS